MAMQQHIRGPHLTIKFQGSHNTPTLNRPGDYGCGLPVTTINKPAKTQKGSKTHLKLPGVAFFFFTVLVEANQLTHPRPVN